MKAIVKAQRGYSLQQIAEPQVTEPDEIKIRVQSAALCRTDLYVADEIIPVQEGRILGHEASGVITECGHDVKSFKPGDSVIINPLRSCGQCSDCRENRQHHCQDSSFMGIDYDGAFAEYTVISESEAHHLPDKSSFATGAYAEPVAATLAILGTSIAQDQTIAVAGAGRIAELAVEILNNHGFLNALPLHQAPAEMLFDSIIESNNDPGTIQQCIDHLRPEGLLILKSRNPSNLSLPTIPLLKKRLRLESAYYSNFETAVEYLSKHHTQLEARIGTQWTLDQYQEAFTEAESSEALKTYFDLS